MTDVRVVQPHDLDPDTARSRMASFEELVQKYGVRFQWNRLTASLKGVGVGGSVEVKEREVVVHVKLGLLARAAGIDPKRLRDSIARRLKQAFEP